MFIALDLDSALGLARLALANVYIRTEAWQQALAQLDSYIKETPRAADRGQVLVKHEQIERTTNHPAFTASNRASAAFPWLVAGFQDCEVFTEPGAARNIITV